MTTAVCPVCGEAREARKDGRVSAHRRSGFRPGRLGLVRVRCEGTGRKPVPPGTPWKDPL